VFVNDIGQFKILKERLNKEENYTAWKI
jgi:hypothetical protein